MFHFQHIGKKLCVDATEETGHLGRLLNRSVHRANCVPKVRVFGNSPRILLYAKRDIFKGEELLYDYGDRIRLEKHNVQGVTNKNGKEGGGRRGS